MRLFSAATLKAAKQTGESAPWAAAAWQSMQWRVDAWHRSPGSIPSEAGGWIHNYVCDEHWLPLIYEGESPERHVCPAGHVYSGEEYEAAWRVWRHRQISDLSREAALTWAVLGSEVGRQTAVAILNQYADFYIGFDAESNAEAWMLNGHAFNQALTEALWAMPLIHAYDLVVGSLNDAQRERLVRDLWQPLTAVMTRAQDALIARERIDSNYMAWLNVTLGSLGFMLQDEALIERAIDAPAGFISRLNTVILADGFEFECTPYYHNFVLLADLMLAEAACANGVDLYAVSGSGGQTLTGMGCALTKMTWPDGSMIDAAEGSYWQNSIYDSELCQVFEMLHGRAPDPVFAWALQSAYERQDAVRDNWAALLYGRDDVATAVVPPPAHSLLDASGFAVLRSQKKLAAMVAFGPYHTDHHQYDRLSMAVWPFSRDAGSPLYGLSTRRAWYPHSYAHNTLIVDGQTHADCGGELLSWNGRGVSAAVSEAYPDVQIERTVEMEDGVLHDEIVVQAREPHTYDWVFHLDGELAGFDASDPLTGPLAEDGPAAFIQLRAQKQIDDSVSFEIEYDAIAYRLTLRGERPFILLLGTAPGTSRHPQQRRHVLIGRSKSTRQRYQLTIAQNQHD